MITEGDFTAETAERKTERDRIHYGEHGEERIAQGIELLLISRNPIPLLMKIHQVSGNLLKYVHSRLLLLL
jgi:hypothetical protein